MSFDDVRLVILAADALLIYAADGQFAQLVPLEFASLPLSLHAYYESLLTTSIRDGEAGLG